MTAGHSTIARVDASLWRVRRLDRVTDGALIAAAAFILAAAIIAGISISQSWPRQRDAVGLLR